MHSSSASPAAAREPGTRQRFRRFAVSVLALTIGACSMDAELADKTPAPDSGSQSSVNGQNDPYTVDSGAILRIAEATLAAGDSTTAIGLYRRAIAGDPTNATAREGLGFALAEAGGHPAAEEAFRAALALAPDRPGALRGLGNALIAQNRPAEALAPLEQALAAGETDSRLFNSLGVALDSTGEHGRAQQVYRQGLAHDPNNLKIQNNLGLSLALSGDHAAAIALLDDVAGHPEAGARQRQNLALAYGLAGQSDRAAAIAGRDLNVAELHNNLTYYAHNRERAPRGVDGSTAFNEKTINAFGQVVDVPSITPHPSVAVAETTLDETGYEAPSEALTAVTEEQGPVILTVPAESADLVAEAKPSLALAEIETGQDVQARTLQAQEAAAVTVTVDGEAERMAAAGQVTAVDGALVDVATAATADTDLDTAVAAGSQPIDTASDAAIQALTTALGDWLGPDGEATPIVAGESENGMLPDNEITTLDNTTALPTEPDTATADAPQVMAAARSIHGAADDAAATTGAPADGAAGPVWDTAPYTPPPSDAMMAAVDAAFADWDMTAAAGTDVADERLPHPLANGALLLASDASPRSPTERAAGTDSAAKARGDAWSLEAERGAFMLAAAIILGGLLVVMLIAGLFGAPRPPRPAAAAY